MWSYADPGSNAKDAVRFALGDTRSDDPQFQDEEVAYLLTQTGGDVVGAAILGCRRMMAHYAAKTQKSIGSMSASFQQKYEHYRDLIPVLQAERSEGANFSLGVDADALNERPIFTRHMHEYGWHDAWSRQTS